MKKSKLLEPIGCWWVYVESYQNVANWGTNYRKIVG